MPLPHPRRRRHRGRARRGSSAACPPSESIFTAHPYTVVSLDYIKSEKRRAEFLRACPDFVIVDEAHTCAATGQGRHQRYELLKGLAGAAERHIVMLTATPHSGDEAAFYRLLGLLDPSFERLAEAQGEARERLRDTLARHFVQRRRPDIDEWNEGRLFPRRRDEGADLPAHRRMGELLRCRSRLLRRGRRARRRAMSAAGG